MAETFVLPAQYTATDQGAVGAGWKLYFFETGTTTPKTTYQDAAKNTAHAHPVVADSAGRFAPIYMDGTYRVQLKKADDTLVKDSDPVGLSILSDLASSAAGLGAELVDKLTVDTQASLTALAKPSAAIRVNVRRRTTSESIGDGSGGEWVWDSSSTATADGGTILQADAGGTGRWLREYNGSWQVEWFGTDFATAIQAAVDAIPSGEYRKVESRYGAYTMTSGVTVGNAKVEFDFHGSTITVGANLTDAFLCNNASGQMIFRNGKLDGNKANYTVSGAGVKCEGSVLPQFFNFQIHSCSGYNCRVTGAATGLFLSEHSQFNNAGVIGLSVVSSDNNARAKLLDTECLNNDGGHGALIETADGIDILGGVYDGNTGGSAAGGASCRNASHIHVIGATMSDNGNAGLYIGLGALQATVSGCTMEDNGNYNISLDTISNAPATRQEVNVTVAGNTLNGSQYSIRVNGCYGYTIAGNTIKSPSINSIYALNGSGNGSIQGNTFRGATTQIQIAGADSVGNKTEENRIGYDNHWFDLTSGLSPILNVSTGANNGFVATQYTDDIPNSNNAPHAKVQVIDTSASNRTLTLPEVQYCGPGQVVQIINGGGNNLNVNRGGTDLIYNAGGTTATGHTYTNIFEGGEYISVDDGSNVGWIRTTRS